MELKKIVSGLEGLKAKGNVDIDITNIDSNSKNIKPGGLFVAIKGFATDGHLYIEDAVKNGAVAVMVDLEEDLKALKLPKDVTIIAVKGTREAAAKMACNFYENPSKKLKLVGVTGTKGKTTTTFMIKSILEKKGLKVGLIGTIATYIGDKMLSESSRTTPDCFELQKIFSQMVKAKVDVCVMEVSSQSLKLDRVANCDFDMAVFTNFTKDHISEKEHPDMEDYYNSKLRLFEMCNTGFVNADDFKTIKVKSKFPESQIKTYGIDNQADLLAKDITITNVSVDFKVKIGDRNERVKVGIPGRFSVYNALAAISVGTKFGANAEEIKEALLDIKVPGRSELVPNKLELPIMIDYAHSPESLENILSAVKSYTKGKVISVFGCGGDRDKGKRPLMGEISGKLASFTIITTDNPRTEDPATIIKEIEAGIKKTNGKYVCIEDRVEAIKEAINMATKKDLIVLAGKGHEPYQEINGVKHPFDERIIVNEIISKMKTKK